jgi:hypothetical protein
MAAFAQMLRCNNNNDDDDGGGGDNSKKGDYKLSRREGRKFKILNVSFRLDSNVD